MALLIERSNFARGIAGEIVVISEALCSLNSEIISCNPSVTEELH